MSIRIGLYDFFSFTLPGVLYSFAVVYFLITIETIQIDLNTLLIATKDQIILLLIFSYLLGLIMEPLSKPWYRIFAPMGLEKTMLDEFRKRYAVNVKFKPFDWPILLAFIRRKNLEIAGEIDRLNALKVMLRNVSFGLLLIAAITIILFIHTNFYFLNLLLAFLLIALSIIANREAAKFDRWFFILIYQTTTAFNLEATDFTTLISAGNLQSGEKHKEKHEKYNTKRE